MKTVTDLVPRLTGKLLQPNVFVNILRSHGIIGILVSFWLADSITHQVRISGKTLDSVLTPVEMILVIAWLPIVILGVVLAFTAKKSFPDWRQRTTKNGKNHFANLFIAAICLSPAVLILFWNPRSGLFTRLSQCLSVMAFVTSYTLLFASMPLFAKAYRPPERPKWCVRCSGNGAIRVRVSYDVDLFEMPNDIDFVKNYGDGFKTVSCDACGGTGREWKTKSLSENFLIWKSDDIRGKRLISAVQFRV